MVTFFCTFPFVKRFLAIFLPRDPHHHPGMNSEQILLFCLHKWISKDPERKMSLGDSMGHTSQVAPLMWSGDAEVPYPHSHLWRIVCCWNGQGACGFQVPAVMSL